VTPFGIKLRALRRVRSIALKRMASDLHLSPAYLSALEHGHRGRPTPALVVQICEYFNLIWDDYEEMHRLAALSWSTPRGCRRAPPNSPICSPRRSRGSTMT
jgi:transcriptional regulator with XRE-family HTH domain